MDRFSNNRNETGEIVAVAAQAFAREFARRYGDVFLLSSAIAGTLTTVTHILGPLFKALTFVNFGGIGFEDWLPLGVVLALFRQRAVSKHRPIRSGS